MKKIGLTFLILSLAIIAGALIGNSLKNRRVDADVKTLVVSTPAPAAERQFTWGTTVRPYILAKKASDFRESDLEQQFVYAKDLFPRNGAVRANIESDSRINDLLVQYAQKYDLKLYLILEEIKDFNPDIDYKAAADQLATRIVARYKGKVAYYQLSNELSGVVFYHGTDNGPKLDAGYGLSMDQKRYSHVLEYTRALSSKIRQLDPDAKIVITGHWVLIKPIMELLKDGVQADIIGWNWSSGESDQPATKNIDNYGLMDIPKMAKDAGKEFMIIEANRDDGSMNGHETDQAAYIRTLAQNSYNNGNVSGYFHFILSDGNDDTAMSHLGLIKLVQDSSGNFAFGEKKPSYDALKNVARNLNNCASCLDPSPQK